jgi:hypothetical protein
MFECYGSSLLIVYEGDESVDLTEDHISMYAIDFAHAYKIKNGGSDENYLFGLRNLIKWLTELEQRQK